VAEAAPAPATDARFALIGVVNPKAAQAAREGLALIAVDGKPPRAYRVGAVIEGTHVLKAVSARGATLGLKDGGASVALSIAPLAAAATGTLPALEQVRARPPICLRAWCRSAHRRNSRPRHRTRWARTQAQAARSCRKAHPPIQPEGQSGGAAPTE
jgi:hypothetical protein